MAETSKPAAPRASEPPKPKRSETEQELLTMKRMSKMLEELPEPSRGRVANWVISKYVQATTPGNSARATGPSS